MITCKKDDEEALCNRKKRSAVDVDDADHGDEETGKKLLLAD